MLPQLILQALSIQMSAFTAGVYGVALLMILIFSGFPIAFAMGLVGVMGAWYVRDFNVGMVTLQITVLPAVGEYFLTVVPLFVAMGFVCYATALSKDLYEAFYKIFGGIPGALSITSVVACGVFAAICGDSGATGATMASVAIPEMKKAKYKDSLAAGCIAAGGTLGILIPPSIGFIIYGLITEQSIGKLFVAGIIPGCLLTVMFCALIFLQCKMNPALGPASPKVSLMVRISAIRGLVPALILIGIVLGGMFAGIFTATEAGGVGFVTAILMGLVLKRFSRKGLFNALLESVNVTAMVFTIFIGVSLLNNFMGLSELSLTLGNLVGSMHVSRYVILVVVMFIYLILGCTMNIIPMIMLTLPIIFPVITGLGFDPIWFGVVMSAVP
ncbi:TRAP transporter, DctM subunit [delta proteobacterium NaphS2]|nr:TRAP transporter, DctM subunit [delta proteobacterium NaphS2]